MTKGRTADGWAQLQPFLPHRSRLRVGGIGMMSFVGGLAESGVLVLLTLTADSLIRQSDEVNVAGVGLTLRAGVVIALALVIVRIGLTLSTSAATARFSSQVMETAQRSLLNAYLHSTHEVRSTRPRGDFGAVMVNHARLTGDLASSFATVAASACGLIAFGGMSLTINPIATLGIAAIGGMVLLAMRPLRAQTRNAADAFADSARIVSTEVSEVEALHREIELFRVGDEVESRLEPRIELGAERIRRLRFLGNAIPQLFQAALLAAAVLSLLFIVDTVDGADLAAVGAVVLLLIRSMSSAQQYVTSNQRVIEYTPYAVGVTELTEMLNSCPSQFGSEHPEQLFPLRLDHVCFSYDGHRKVLHDLNLELDQNEMIGVVGPSGAGKSTLVELLLRLRSPTSGRITAKGLELDQVDPAEFARRVAFVPQQAVMIAGTVAENVDLFRGIPEERIRAAIKEAHLSAEIDALPEGIHTLLGPDDRSLSGGQQQRLTIARALAGDPEILVLDEPTSALDAVSENAVRRTLSELPVGRIVVIVAHRYSTLRSCSRILVLRDGRVDIDASPDEVAERSAFFRTMVASDS